MDSTPHIRCLLLSLSQSERNAGEAGGTFWKLAMAGSLSLRFQLKEGLQLYASSLPGNLAWMAVANSRASSMSGVDVSTHSMSANGAYARPRATAACPPHRHKADVLIKPSQRHQPLK